MDAEQVYDTARVAARDVMLKSLMLDVRHQGTVSIPKKKILWLLGDRKYENWKAWAALLDAWEEIGERRDTLYGTYDGPRITLIAGKPDQICATWASNGKEDQPAAAPEPAEREEDLVET